MKLLVLSDLHVDIWQDEPLDPVAHFESRRIDAEADVVVLAGDIHEGVQSPMWAREAFPDKPIVLVAGNHEFYGQHWHNNLNRIRQRSQELGIHFLENEVVEIGGTRFLGCTLWTDYLLHGENTKEQCMAEALRFMADFRYIKTEGLTPDHALARHEASAAWLDEQLSLGDPARTVVVTHHAPLFGSIPEYFFEDKLAPTYASNLPNLVGRSALWIHGHVHESYDYKHGMTRVVCNPRGYPDMQREPLNPEFNPGLLVEI